MEDWRDKAISKIYHRWHVLHLPVNTELFRGVHAHQNYFERQVHRFFGTFKTAGLYAFNTIFPRSDFGKIISYTTTQDLYLLDMTKQENYQRMTKLWPDLIPYLHRTFLNSENEIIRTSIVSSDQLFMTFFCGAIMDQELDGWAYPTFPGFHDEVMLCSANRYLLKTPFEWRIAPDLNWSSEYIEQMIENEQLLPGIYQGKDLLVETYNGHVNRILILGDYGLTSKWNVIEEEVDIPKKYVPELTNPSDKFFFD